MSDSSTSNVAAAKIDRLLYVCAGAAVLTRSSPVGRTSLRALRASRCFLSHLATEAGQETARSEWLIRRRSVPMVDKQPDDRIRIGCDNQTNRNRRPQSESIPDTRDLRPQ